MKPITICKTIDIDAPVDQVWQYIGTEDGLRQWWGTDVEIETCQGGRCAESFLHNGQMHRLTGAVTVYDPPRQLTLALRDAERRDGWPTCTTVSITLETTADGTRISVLHQAVGPIFDSGMVHPLDAVLSSTENAGRSRRGQPSGHAPIHAPENSVHTAPFLAANRLPQPDHSSRFTADWRGRLHTLRNLVIQAPSQAISENAQ